MAYVPTPWTTSWIRTKTIAIAGDELRQAAALAEQAASHAHNALNKIARLYVESTG